MSQLCVGGAAAIRSQIPVFDYDCTAFGYDVDQNKATAGTVPVVKDDRRGAAAGASETGLDYFGARYFSGAQGRFTTPDPLMASGRPENPQSWNRYAYVSNNPLRSIDPTGLEEERVTSTLRPVCAEGYTGPNCDDPVIHGSNGGNGAVILDSAASMAAPVVNTLAVATPLVPVAAFGGAALLGLSTPTVAAAGTAGVAAAESPQGQRAVAGLLPAAQNGLQWAGEVTSSVTESASTMYRVWGGASEQVGAWVTPNLPTSASQAISSLSLPTGNTAAFVSQVLVPAGTRIQTGLAAPLFNQPGGGVQVLLLQYLPLVNFGPGVPLR